MICCLQNLLPGLVLNRAENRREDAGISFAIQCVVSEQTKSTGEKENMNTQTEVQYDNEAYRANGCIWEGWMIFGGVTCNQAFDEGYDAAFSGQTDCRHEHHALRAAFRSGLEQGREENS